MLRVCRVDSPAKKQAADQEGCTMIMEGCTMIMEGCTMIMEGRTMIMEGRTMIMEGCTMIMGVVEACALEVCYACMGKGACTCTLHMQLCSNETNGVP